MNRLLTKLILAILFLAPGVILAHGGVNDEELIIRMNENGFEPKELTVVEGDEVLFINNDDVDRWPASNFHPTHTLYPEFDPMKAIKPGESWKMKFEEVGTHRMHDHLIPHMTGTIVVLKNESRASASESGAERAKTSSLMGFLERIKVFFVKIFKVSAKGTQAVTKAELEEFKSLSEKEKHAWLEAKSEAVNPQTSWQYVLAAYDSPEGTTGNAHDMAHLVGQLLFKASGFEGLMHCTPVFAFGCYHGLMEVAFDKDKPQNYRKKLLEAEEACGNLGEENNPARWSCIHGIGHGVITYREHETRLALADCDQLKETVRTYCYDGTFMELSISAVPSFYKTSDPLYPCNAIEERYRSACARSQSRVMRDKFGFSTGKIALVCANSGSEAIRYHCIDSLGYFMGQMSGGDPHKIISGCADIASEGGRTQCLAAAAGELVFQNVAGWQKSAPDVCASLTEKGEMECLSRIERVKKSYGRN